MNVNTKNMKFIKFNNQVMNWVKFNGQKIWELIKGLIASGIPPISIKTNGSNILNYKITGNTGGVGNSTANGYEIPLKISGVNLVDYTKAVARNSSEKVVIDTSQNGVIWTGSYFFKIPCSIPAGKVISCNVLGEFSGKWAIEYTDGKVEGNIWLYQNYTTAKEVKFVYIYKISPTTTGTEMLFTDIIVNYGETALPYEPYFEPITKTIALNAPLNENESISYKADGLPTLESFNGTTIYDVETDIKPSNMEVEYEGE